MRAERVQDSSISWNGLLLRDESSCHHPSISNNIVTSVDEGCTEVWNSWKISIFVCLSRRTDDLQGYYQSLLLWVCSENLEVASFALLTCIFYAVFVAD